MDILLFPLCRGHKRVAEHGNHLKHTPPSIGRGCRLQVAAAEEEEVEEAQEDDVSYPTHGQWQNSVLRSSEGEGARDLTYIAQPAASCLLLCLSPRPRCSLATDLTQDNRSLQCWSMVWVKVQDSIGHPWGTLPVS